MKKDLILLASFNSIGVTVYVFLISFVMRHGATIFGKMDGYLGFVAFLLLFVLSAAITGFLVLGQPILFYIDGKKSEAFSLFLWTIGFLSVITVVALVI